MSFPITIEREVGGWEHEEVQDRTPSVAREGGGAAPLVTRESGGAATSTTRDSSQTFDCREHERNSARLHARIGARFGPPHHLIVVTSPPPRGTPRRVTWGLLSSLGGFVIRIRIPCIVHVSCMYLACILMCPVHIHQDTSRYIEIHRDTFVSSLWPS